MVSKECKKCGAIKELREFKTDRTCVNNKAGTCKECARIVGNKYYHMLYVANHKRIIEYE